MFVTFIKKTEVFPEFRAHVCLMAVTKEAGKKNFVEEEYQAYFKWEGILDGWAATPFALSSGSREKRWRELW